MQPLEILTFFGDGGAHAGRVSEGPGYRMRFSQFFFEDIVALGPGDENPHFRETPLRWTLDALRNGGFHAVKSDGNDAFLLQGVLVSRGHQPPPFLIVESDHFARISHLRSAFHRVLGVDVFPGMLASPRNHWLAISSASRDFYLNAGIPEEQLFYFPMCVESIAFSFPEVRAAVHKPADGELPPIARDVRGKFLAVGTHERDYPTLIEAVRGLDVETHIICEARLHPSDSPPGVVWHPSVPMRDFVAAMRAAAAVIVPLKPLERNFGQMGVALPMSLGKSVIATRVASLGDHITDGETGLFVEPGDPASLRAALRRVLDDPSLTARLGAAAREREAHFSELAARTVDSLLARVAAINNLPHGTRP